MRMCVRVARERGRSLPWSNVWFTMTWSTRCCVNFPFGAQDGVGVWEGRIVEVLGGVGGVGGNEKS